MIRAPGQLHEAPECLSDLDWWILNLCQGRASISLRVMKLDDCPHSSAPVLLDFLGSLGLAASTPHTAGWGHPQPTTTPSGGRYHREATIYCQAYGQCLLRHGTFVLGQMS